MDGQKDGDRDGEGADTRDLATQAGFANTLPAPDLPPFVLVPRLDLSLGFLGWPR